MAEKGWTSRMATAAGAAAGTGAAQLGLGYGLGVIVWPVVATPDDSAWLGSLGWATWITASATVFGAVIASRLGGGLPTRSGGPWRLALATSAAIGALVVVALIALPARSAVRVDTFSPQVIAGGYALLGLVLGLIVAYWAVTCRPVAANLIGTAVWLWALAIAAIVVELTLHRSSATYLTSWQFAEAVDGVRYGTIYWPSGLLTLAAAFLVGIITASPAARRGDLGVGAATSGAAGPLLVAVAFLALAPRLTGSVGPLESAYLLAPYAVLAGLAGSVLAVSIGRAAADRRARRTAPRPDDDGRDDRDTGGRAEPTDPGADHRARTSGGSTEADAVPAADPPAEPITAAPKTKVPTPTGRVKLPAQPTPDSAARSGKTPDGERGPASGAAPAPAPAAGTAAAGGTAAAPATGTATPPPSAGTAPPQPSAGTPRSGRGTGSTNPAVSRGTANGRDRGRQGRPSGNGSPTEPPPSAAADPEIAAAARPPRPKKATPATDNKQSKSTVTPPPADPTIAQINPNPPKTG
jgi:hypothetical protein